MSKSLKKKSIVYGILSIVCILLSLISLAFNEWVLIPSMVITSLFGYLVLFIYYIEGKSTDTKMYLVYIFVRYIVMAIGLVICCFLIKFTMGEEIVKQRYLMTLFAAIPYIFPVIVLLGSKAEK